MKRKFCITLILLFIFSSLSLADYLEVRRKATIKAQPERDGLVLIHLEKGIQLVLLDSGQQENYYYHVRLPGSQQDGWIYRTLVRRHAGSMTVPQEDNAPQARQHLTIGKPEAFHEKMRQGYALAHDSRLKIPVWVQYQLCADDLDGPVNRTDDFRADVTIPEGSRAEKSDYTGSGFARGHMAPAEDMTRSMQVMSESFILSNMAPQIGSKFNGAVWKSLENAVRDWTKKRQCLTIITGPVFKSNEAKIVQYKVIGDNQVAVPTHFYKIIVDSNDPQNVQALAFLFPHEELSGRDFDDFLVSIDEIEKATGLNFLSALPEGTQHLVESEKAEKSWER